MMSRLRAMLWLSPLSVLAVASGGLTACKQGLSLPEEEAVAEADAGRGVETSHSNATADDPEPEPCERSEDGEACAEGKHCIKQRCVFNSCGDGIKAGDEECDDGNELVGDACSPSCKPTPATCGDGQMDEGEECDDGNRIDTDTCSQSCTRNKCGNQRVDPGEECDDGNRNDADSCSNSCLRQLCRNGILDPGEECDDANTNPNDGCTNACQLIVCGDGMPEQQEECDDGNRVDTDGCSNACTANMCGNNRVDPGEACDGGRTADGKMIPDTARCGADCRAVVSDDGCRKCERDYCSNYMDTGFDLAAGCYDMVPELSTGVIKEFNRVCSALMRCVRANRCDVGWNSQVDDTISCYCGRDVSIDECFAGTKIQGPCIAEYEAATGATSGDFMTVANLAVDLTLPSGFVRYLSECQRTYCLKECR